MEAIKSRSKSSYMSWEVRAIKLIHKFIKQSLTLHSGFLRPETCPLINNLWNRLIRPESLLWSRIIYSSGIQTNLLDFNFCFPSFPTNFPSSHFPISVAIIQRRSRVVPSSFSRRSNADLIRIGELRWNENLTQSS